MSWTLDNDRPIYLQLMERIQRDIIAGVYQPGDKLPSVRDLALEAAVNPNTMQKALSELERSGLVYSQRTSGRFITEDTEMLTQMKKELATEHIQEFFQKMEQLGFSRAELLTLVTKAAGCGDESSFWYLFVNFLMGLAILNLFGWESIVFIIIN